MKGQAATPLTRSTFKAFCLGLEHSENGGFNPCSNGKCF